MKKIKNLKISFVIIFILQLSFAFILISAPQIALADDAPKPLDFRPSVQLPVNGLNKEKIQVGQYHESTGIMSSDLLAKYIQGFYKYGQAIVAIIAALALMAGGVVWLTSAGSKEKISKAKDLISGSIIGLVILFTSWIILNTINPDLLQLKVINTQVIKKINQVCCEHGNIAETITDIACNNKGGKSFTFETNSLGNKVYYAPNRPNAAGSKCVLPGCCVFKANNNYIKSCTNTTPDNCSDHKGTFQTGSCDTLDYCNGATDLCASEQRKDGSNCFLDIMSAGNGETGFCYNKICWLGDDGKVGEPCGNELYSKCTIDTPINGNKCDGDWDGRSCTSGVTCCKFDANGNRINN